MGAYAPRRRLLRSAIATAHAWAKPGLKGLGKGSRAICSHDEDVITMAVAAARACLGGGDNRSPDRLLLASTSLPFADRQNATVVGEALNLAEDLQTADISGSQRAATSALLLGLQHGGAECMVVGAEKCLTRAGSVEEFTVGDAAAALTTGEDQQLARFIGSHSISRDMVDHYRTAQSDYNYALEERWIRDCGLMEIIPETVAALLTKLHMLPEQIDRLLIAGVDGRPAAQIAARCSIDKMALHEGLKAPIGHAGSADALLLLVDALQAAEPDQHILLVGFGQGCDALLFQTTDIVHRARESHGVAAAIAAGVDDTNYLRYLSFAGLVDIDWGMRAERDNRTSQAAFYRGRRAITGFVGGLCRDCGVAQFPKTALCVNPNCGKQDTQDDEMFANKAGQVKSFTEDWLALSLNPPLMYGSVRFDRQSTLMMEFTDFDPGELSIGSKLQMVFRIKDFDPLRGYHRYFWKAAPAAE